ncbi:MAG: M48 family metalloprotease [Marivibrio sp.]|uniref:M48 family metalloprotease n=1 Tax=Marivibrio sp. TaxID=2039719 RepID=UPI0032EDE1EB
MRFSTFWRSAVNARTARRGRRRLSALAAAALAFALAAPADLHAQGRSMSLVRDTETENAMRVYLAPIFESAGLDPASVRIHLVKDDAINAFVAGGQNIFIHTGLLTAADGPGEVIGVLAHEVGHITGGHLARFRENLENAQIQSLAALILGGAAAIAAGEPGGVGAAVSLGDQIGRRSMLSYTRDMERAADQAAMDFLKAAGLSPKGYEQILVKLQRRAKLYSAGANPYEQTHPVTEDRLAFVRNQLETWPVENADMPQEYIDLHHRIKAKLAGYIQDPQRTLEDYGPTRDDVPARYARAVAYMRDYKPDEALRLAEGLIADFPNDPFFYELKGDIYLNTGQVEKAVEPYEQAVQMLPWAALIRIQLARALLEQNRSGVEEQALDHLIKARRYEPDSSELWRLTAAAYNRLGDMGQVALAQAERSFRGGRNQEAKAHADRAMELLPEHGASWLRAQDIALQVEERQRRDE